MFLQNTGYVDLIKRTIKDELSTVEHYEDRGFAFDYVKMKIRDATTTFAKKFHSEQKQLETDLTHRLDNLSNEHTLSGSADILEVMDGIKKELEQIQYLKTKGVMPRSKLSNIKYGERNSAYFLSLEKVNAERKTIIALKKDNNNTIYDQSYTPSQWGNYTTIACSITPLPP